MPDMTLRDDEADSQETSGAAGRPDRTEGLFIVALGASAGGLESLEKFFDNLPDDPGMAFVVIQHLSPDYKSLMVELLSKHTAMKVLRAEQNALVEANHVYLIPPRTSMTIRGGHLQLTEQDPGALHLPIDGFLASLGEDQGHRAIGIILSGTGSDGMRGVRAIKDAGGMVMVQAVPDAKFDGMPRSAISTGLVDFILPADQMPQALLQFVQNPGILSEEADPVALYETQQEALERVIAAVRKQTGVDFGFYKPATIVRRVDRRVNINQCLSLKDYADLVEKSITEVNTLYKELLIGVTRFFRDGPAFDVLRQQVIGQIFRQQGEGPVRVWVSGCSTGEEAYSLAMLFQEYQDEHEITRDVKIFATDLDREAVEFAAEGVFPESIVADLTPQQLGRFFIKRKEHYYVKRQLREMIIFAPQNVTRDPPFSNMDLVSCRNLLIYLQPTMQKRVLAMMAYALKHMGFLFLGSSESLGDSAGVFRPVDTRWKIYQKVATDRPLLSESLSAIRHQRPSTTTAAAGRQAGYEEAVLESLIQELVTSRHLACMLIDESFAVRHVFGQMDDLVQFQPGRASLDVRKIMHHDLAIAMTTAVSRARKTGQEVLYSRVSVTSRDLVVNLRVRPVQVRREGEMLLLIVFERVLSAADQGEPTAEVDINEGSQQRIGDLEQELQFTRANLQATIEELQTSNEELQATNEELVTSNEELQSTNEELQSVNEELHTVNSEYQEKIEELTRLNNDMDNLMRSTEVGTLFLDRQLHIRKYTPDVGSIVNIMPQDIGRPLAHITVRARQLDLVTLAEKLRPERKSLVEEVELPEGSSFLVRLSPYWTDSDRLDGLVISFVDVSPVKAAEERTRAVLDAVDDQIAILDETGRIADCNRSWEAMAEAQGDAAAELRVGTDFIRASLGILTGLSGQQLESTRKQVRDVLEGTERSVRLNTGKADGGPPKLLIVERLARIGSGAVVRRVACCGHTMPDCGG